jgi:hypothetical protein
VQEPEQLEGENAAVTPPGSPETEKAGLALPVTKTVMASVADPPYAIEIAVGLADKLRVLDCTATVIALEAETDPLFAVTVTAEEPCAEFDAVRVNVVEQEPEQLDGENDAVTPLGSPEAENVGLAVPVTVAVIEIVEDPPCNRETEAGLADNVMVETVAWYS